MNTYFTYDFAKKAIVGTKTNIAKANKGIEPQYTELCERLAKHSDFIVIEKVFRKNKDKKTYKHLSFNRMKEYIKTQPDNENRLIEFEAIKKVAEAKGAKYPLTKKWFLAKYPEYKENAVSEEEAATLVDENEAALRKAAAELEALELDDEDFDEEEVA